MDQVVNVRFSSVRYIFCSWERKKPGYRKLFKRYGLCLLWTKYCSILCISTLSNRHFYHFGDVFMTKFDRSRNLWILETDHHATYKSNIILSVSVGLILVNFTLGGWVAPGSTVQGSHGTIGLASLDKITELYWVTVWKHAGAHRHPRNFFSVHIHVVSRTQWTCRDLFSFWLSYER